MWMRERERERGKENYYVDLFVHCQGDTLVLEVWSVGIDVRYVFTFDLYC